jgi:hypothetical protein
MPARPDGFTDRIVFRQLHASMTIPDVRDVELRVRSLGSLAKRFARDEELNSFAM